MVSVSRGSGSQNEIRRCRWDSETLSARAETGGPHSRAGGRIPRSTGRAAVLWVETRSEEVPEDLVGKSRRCWWYEAALHATPEIVWRGTQAISLSLVKHREGEVSLE
jgi:hypothetical protein